MKVYPLGKFRWLAGRLVCRECNAEVHPYQRAHKCATAPEGRPTVPAPPTTNRELVFGKPY